MTLLISVVLIAVALTAIVRFNYWRKEGLKLQQHGYVPPAPPLPGRIAFRLINRLARFAMIGPVKVIGRENARFNGRVVIVPNHTYQMDFSMTSRAFPEGFRYLTAVEELRGLRGTMGAWTGAYGVDRKAGGEAVVEASVRILVQKPTSRILIFPQGKLVADNVLRAEDFKTGAVRIARKTSELVDRQPVALVPVGIHYDRDPGHASAFHRFARRFLKGFRRAFGQSNYGGAVCVGKPIVLESLPDDVHEATEVLRLKIQECLEAARAACK